MIDDLGKPKDLKAIEQQLYVTIGEGRRPTRRPWPTTFIA